MLQTWPPGCPNDVRGRHRRIRELPGSTRTRGVAGGSSERAPPGGPPDQEVTFRCHRSLPRHFQFIRPVQTQPRGSQGRVFPVQWRVAAFQCNHPVTGCHNPIWIAVVLSNGPGECAAIGANRYNPTSCPYCLSMNGPVVLSGRAIKETTHDCQTLRPMGA